MCLFFHNWYRGKNGFDTCANYGITGPLPGEFAFHRTDNGVCVYRRERHCLDCDRVDYAVLLPYEQHSTRDFTWVNINHLLTDTTIRRAALKVQQINDKIKYLQEILPLFEKIHKERLSRHIIPDME
jgi:hypothetical protein